MFAILISLILILIIAILGLATLDMLSISIQGISQTDDKARQAMIDEYLRQRELQKSADEKSLSSQNETREEDKDETT